MARKKTTPSRQTQFNNFLFIIISVGIALWLLMGYLNDADVSTGGTQRATAVPTVTDPPERDATSTEVPTDTNSSDPSIAATATTPIRGTAVPGPATDTPAMPSNVEEGIVVDVVDGDTLDVRLGNRVERVRMIGLNTPESVDPRRPVQCFGVEASTYNKSLTLDQTVFLEEDSTQGSRDQYDRLLRYVWLADGRLVNLELIANGYAAQYTFDTPYKYRDLFRAAERTAQSTGAGLWSPQTCNGDFDASPDFGTVSSGDGSECSEGCIQQPAGCTIKGNVNSAGRQIYHVDGESNAYDSVNMNPSEGDRWFCTVEEAEGAGFISAP